MSDENATVEVPANEQLTYVAADVARNDHDDFAAALSELYTLLAYIDAEGPANHSDLHSGVGDDLDGDLNQWVEVLDKLAEMGVVESTDDGFETSSKTGAWTVF